MVEAIKKIKVKTMITETFSFNIKVVLKKDYSHPLKILVQYLTKDSEYYVLQCGLKRKDASFLFFVLYLANFCKEFFIF